METPGKVFVATSIVMRLDVISFLVATVDSYLRNSWLTVLRKIMKQCRPRQPIKIRKLFFFLAKAWRSPHSYYQKKKLYRQKHASYTIQNWILQIFDIHRAPSHLFFFLSVET